MERVIILFEKVGAYVFDTWEIFFKSTGQSLTVFHHIVHTFINQHTQFWSEQFNIFHKLFFLALNRLIWHSFCNFNRVGEFILTFGGEFINSVDLPLEVILYTGQWFADTLPILINSYNNLFILSVNPLMVMNHRLMFTTLSRDSQLLLFQSFKYKFKSWSRLFIHCRLYVPIMLYLFAHFEDFLINVIFQHVIICFEYIARLIKILDVVLSSVKSLIVMRVLKNGKTELI